MNEMALGYQELLIILAIMILLFGGNRLPQLARGLGQSLRAFKEGQEEGQTKPDETPASPAGQSLQPAMRTNDSEADAVAQRRY